MPRRLLTRWRGTCNRSPLAGSSREYPNTIPTPPTILSRRSAPASGASALIRDSERMHTPGQFGPPAISAFAPLRTYFRGRARGARGPESRAVASGRMKGDAAERYLADEISAAAACNDRSGDCARFRASLGRALSGGRYRVSTATSNCPSLGDILANRKRGVDIGGAIHPVFTLERRHATLFTSARRSAKRGWN